ncbi:MAG TPA: mechanosensitive ion channel [Pyrinomonadaceae bacterium]|nr:mechanosensitive ion channel [Pyrinomonadaceae bacterium]
MVLFAFQAEEAVSRDLSSLFNYPIFNLGGTTITPITIAVLIVLSLLLVWLSGRAKRLLVHRLLARTRMDIGARQAIGTISRYVVLFLGFLIILQAVGINLTALTVLAGAVGVGIGFGMQNIANNFISGLIILFERPIKVGDRVEVDDVSGDVKKIGARSTVILTNDNVSIIVPNSKFISDTVVNWSLADNIVRFKIPVTVSSDSDIDFVMHSLLEIANENEAVLDDPAPTVRLTEFASDGLTFELRAWSSISLHRPQLLKSDVNLEIVKKFRANNIELPYPQRDLRIRDAKDLVDAFKSSGKGSASASTA